jgi:alpha 1,3-glucosidase
MQCFKRNIKRCGQDSWSRRQRNLNKEQVQYLLDSDQQQNPSIHIKDGSVFANITEKISDTRYFMRIDLHQDSVIRLRIDESQPYQNKKRYSPDTIIEKERVSIENIRTEGNFHVLDINNEKQFRFNNNLQFELLEKGKVVLTANSRGLFYLEYFREKPEDLTSEFEPAKNIDEETSSSSSSEEPQKENIPSKTIDFSHAWVEHFEGVTEELEHGPQSVGMDFTFNAENVYGIPMHASDLSLKTTTGENAEYQEPFRLYNLDAFEFQLNEPMSLYGSVPMMMGHSENHTSGLYWHNCSETWIDVQKNLVPETNQEVTQTHWFSETGLLDVFFLSGPLPKDIFRQFTSIVGTQALPTSFSLAYHQCRWNIMMKRMFDM